MNLFDFDRILFQAPFRPFRIRHVLNETFDARHPEMAMMMRESVVLETPGSNQQVVPSLSHIVTLEYLPRAKTV